MMKKQTFKTKKYKYNKLLENCGKIPHKNTKNTQNLYCRNSSQIRIYIGT